MNLNQATEFAVRHRYVFLTLLGILLYIAFLGLRDVWYPDEPDIAEVTLAMYLSGDWVSPRRMGVVWVDYPPMIYWIGVISSHVLGDITAFALRLPNAVTAIVIGLLTCFTASRWYDERTGFWSGFALMTCLLFVYEANSYRPDIWFTLGIAAGLLLYLEGTLDKHNLWLRVAGFACLGVAMLSKGILGLLLPGLVLVLWHAYSREWRRILELAPLSLVSIAVFLPWVAGTAQAMGWDNILYEFYAQNFARFQSGFRGHQQPLYYYVMNFWMDFSPWSWLFPAAILWTIRSGRAKDRRVQLLFWWLGTFFVFLSFAETKRQLYMLPAFPAFALLIGPWLASVGQNKGVSAPRERPVRIYSVTLATVLVALGLFLLVFAASIDQVIAALDLNAAELIVAGLLQTPLAILGAVLLAGGIWIGLAWKKKDSQAALKKIGLTYVAMYVVVVGVVMPNFAASKTYKPQGEWIRSVIGPDQTHIGMVYPGGGGIRKRGAFGFETGGVMVDLLESEEQIEGFFDQYPDSMVLVEGASLDTIFGRDPQGWETRKIRELWVGKTLYVVVGAP